jgi:serine/threonine protein phosphatase 1
MIKSDSRAISPAQRPSLTASSSSLSSFRSSAEIFFSSTQVLRPLIPIQQQTEDDLLWIRDDFLLWDKEFEKIVVHGHRPVLEPDIRFNRINIDTGTFATGRLTCMTIEAAKIMPLIDVRDWLDELRGVEIPPGDTIGTEQVGAGDNAGNAITRYPVQGSDSIAAIHAKRLKQDVNAYDATARARLDPRSTNVSRHPRH